MYQLVRNVCLVLMLSTACRSLFAQAVSITGQQLAVTSICPGSLLDVPFTVSGALGVGNAFKVQLSNGGDYVDVLTSGASFNSATGRYSVQATIPVTVAAGTTYRVRVLASNPAIIGSPSNQFAVKIKPGVPVVQPLVVLCQAFTAMQRANPIGLNVNTLPNATAFLYTDASQNSDIGNNTNFYPTQRGSTSTSFYVQYGSFGYSSTQVYPVSERQFFAAQSVDGCQSDRVTMVVRTLYWPLNGPTPANQFDAQYGRLSYCQGEQALPLNVNGHKPPLDSYRILYRGPEAGSVLGPIVPTPSTTTVGRVTYAMRYESTDPTKYCTPQFNASSPVAETYLQVDVNPRPAKPSISSANLTYCQNQAVNPLSAGTTDAGASVLWYTTPTGGTASLTAPRPGTSQTGTFKYYVAQVLNNCEGDRAEITVEVRAVAPNPTVTNVSYCVGQQASPVAAVAASGGSLLWYGAATGGTSTQAAPTPPTANAANLTYYVAQTVGNSCESQRVPVTVTVNGIPAAPVINQTTIPACQNTTASLLAATGANLRWFDVPSGGTGTGTLRPATDVIGSKTYYVSQTVNNCESARSSLVVIVKGKPGVPVVEPLMLLCQVYSAMQRANPIALNVNTLPNATAFLYTDASSNSDIGDNTNLFPTQRRPTSTSFYQRYETFGFSSTQVYPVSERQFFAAQSVDGCQSDRVTMVVRTLYWPNLGPTPVNQYDAQYGRLSYLWCAPYLGPLVKLDNGLNLDPYERQDQAQVYGRLQAQSRSRST